MDALGGWGRGCGTLSGHDMAVVFMESQQLGLLVQARPTQEQASQHSSMDGRESRQAPLLALAATDGCWGRGREESVFFRGVVTGPMLILQ